MRKLVLLLSLLSLIFIPYTLSNAASEWTPYDGYLYDSYDKIPALQTLPPAKRTPEAYALLKAIVTGDDQVVPYLANYLQTAIQNNKQATMGGYHGAESCLVYARFDDFQNVELILIEDIIQASKDLGKSTKFTKDRFLQELRGGFTQVVDGPVAGSYKQQFVTQIDKSKYKYGLFYEHKFFTKIQPEVKEREIKYIYPITKALLGGLYNKDPRVRLLCLSILEQIGEHYFMANDLLIAMIMETIQADKGITLHLTELIKNLVGVLRAYNIIDEQTVLEGDAVKIVMDILKLSEYDLSTIGDPTLRKNVWDNIKFVKYVVKANASEDRALPPWRYIARPQKFFGVNYNKKDSAHPLDPLKEMTEITYYEIIDINGKMKAFKNPYLEMEEFYRRILRILLTFKIESQSTSGMTTTILTQKGEAVVSDDTMTMSNKIIGPDDFTTLDSFVWKILSQPIEGFNSAATNLDIDETDPNKPEYFNVPFRMWRHGFSAFKYLKYGKIVPLGFPDSSETYKLSDLKKIQEVNAKLMAEKEADQINLEKAHKDSPISLALAKEKTVIRQYNKIIKLLFGALGNFSWVVRYGAAEELIRMFQSAEISPRNRVLILKAMMFGAKNKDFAVLKQVYSNEYSSYASNVNSIVKDTFLHSARIPVNKSIYEKAYVDYQDGVGKESITY